MNAITGKWSSYEKRAFKDLKGNKCEVCSIGTEWNSIYLNLEIHNHRTPDPILLCPNCHRQQHRHGTRPYSIDVKMRISNSLKGQVRTDEHRRNLAKSMSRVWRERRKALNGIKPFEKRNS